MIPSECSLSRGVICAIEAYREYLGWYQQNARLSGLLSYRVTAAYKYFSASMDLLNGRDHALADSLTDDMAENWVSYDSFGA